jgi:hypothetical protein
MTRIRTHGNRFSHEVGRGYQSSSRLGGKFKRPEGELSWFTGTAMLLGLFIVLALACAVLP